MDEPEAVDASASAPAAADATTKPLGSMLKDAGIRSAVRDDLREALRDDQFETPGEVRAFVANAAAYAKSERSTLLASSSGHG